MPRGKRKGHPSDSFVSGNPTERGSARLIQIPTLKAGSTPLVGPAEIGERHLASCLMLCGDENGRCNTH
ncbi:unnamed protein product [Durusdinium trenchii]|uniref:Uncharacterized protein n=1 Tax=Durusdinium trenchii TaxID=1381693 RepID=A0ABP0PJ14_9DINO